MTYGLSEKSLYLLRTEFTKFHEIDYAHIFGSRTIGNDKHGSDVDLALYGVRISDEIVNRIRIRLNEELPLPYYFDIVHYESITNDELKKILINTGSGCIRDLIK